MSIKDEIAELKAKIEALEVKAEKCKVEWFEPKHGTLAWYIDRGGQPDSSSFWATDVDINIILQGDVFKTEREAIVESEWRKARYSLKKEIFRLNDGEVQKFTEGKHNYAVGLGEDTIKPASGVAFKTYPRWFYLKSEQLCEQLISTHSKELMTYLSE